MSEVSQEQILADAIKGTVKEVLTESLENENAKKIASLSEQLTAKDTKIEELASVVQQSKMALDVLQKTNSSIDAKYNISKNSGDIDISKIIKVKANLVKEGLNQISNPRTIQSADLNIIDATKDVFSSLNSGDVDFVAQSIINQSVSSGIIGNKEYEMPTINLDSLKVFEEKETFLSNMVNRKSVADVEFMAKGMMYEEYISPNDKPTTVIEGGTANFSSYGSFSTYTRTSDIIGVQHSLSNLMVWTKQDDAIIADFYDKMLRQIEIERSKSIINGYTTELVNGSSVAKYNTGNNGIEGIFSLANNPTNKDSNFSRGIAKVKMGTISGSVGSETIKITYADLDSLIALYPGDNNPQDLIITDSVMRDFQRNVQGTGDLNFDQYFSYRNGRLFYKSNMGEINVIVVPTYTNVQKALIEENGLVGLNKRFALIKQKGFENYVALNPGSSNVITSGFEQGGLLSQQAGKVVAMVGNFKEAYTLHTSTWIHFVRASDFETAKTGRCGIIMNTSHAGVVNNFYNIAIGYAKSS